jgi:poly(3-hydroxybutyrate) depolymerase
MLYLLHEWQRTMLSPLNYWAEASARMFGDANSALSLLPGAQRAAAGCELMFRLGKDYEKPAFGIHSVHAHDADIPVVQLEALAKPFCKLLHFKRISNKKAIVEALDNDPVVLVVAPLSGHHSTLLRDTVHTLLRDHQVYVTDWVDARMVPLSDGTFSLDDYVAYIEEFIRFIGPRQLHVISVCQPTVPVLGAVALMAARGEDIPLSLTLMGGPIDTRESPTSVDDLATTRPLSWFRSQVIQEVPRQYPGAGRKVYPGFLQHAGFIAMNPSRHLMSHWDFYENLRRGDLDDADAHRQFYDEYNAVLDMPAEYYLDTIQTVFQEHRLPRGLWDVAGERVVPAAIRNTALLTIEGELDDISGSGQTEAAHALCKGIAKKNKKHLTIQGAGHFGIFSGRRWREVVYPDVRKFIAKADKARVAD